MTERDLSWLDDDGQTDDSGEPEEEDSDAQLADVQSGDEDEEGEAEEAIADPEAIDTGAEALLSWNPAADPDKAAADALFAEQQEQARRLSADYVPEPDPLTTMEQAAQKAATMSQQDLEYFTNQLREAADKRQREARANQPGYDASGEPVVVEPPFDPSSLDSKDFDIFLSAAARGGADPSRTPAGFTKEQWEKAVDSALGAGAER